MIKLVDVWKDYFIDSEITFTALKGINLEIRKGEYISVVGPSGSGKSTLMHIIGLLDRPTRGEVYIENKKVSDLSDSELSTLRNKFIGFVFQQFNLIPNMTVLQNVLLPTVYAREKLDFNPKKRALELLKRVGILEKKDSYPNQLSGGQQQRVAIARALIMKPKVIVADEPTGNLDSKTGREILELMERMNKEEGVTLVIVTHDRDIAKRAKRKIEILDGEVKNNNQ